VGLPAISTTLTGIPEIIEHGNALVPPGDSIRLAMAVEEVLTNPELQQRLGLEGRSKAEKDFDIRKNVLILQDLFARSAGGQNDCFEPTGPRSDRERQANGQQAPWSSRENLIPLS